MDRDGEIMGVDGHIALVKAALEKFQVQCSSRNTIICGFGAE
jgi:hypothetical protein